MAGDASRWTTVYTGPVWRALSVQSLLDEAGFLTQVPDSNTRTIDPFITGGDAFSLSVLVPERDMSAALAVVASHEKSAPATAPAERDTALARLAHRMRWLTTMVVTAPIAFALGLVYLVRVRRADVRPADHAFNLFTIAVAGLLTIVAVLMFGSMLAQGR
jgi:hypothetical protein